MAVDPQIQMLLSLRANLPALHTLSVDDARAQFAAREFPGLRIPDVASVTNRDMQGPGGSLGLRVYTPLGAGPFPLMVFFHGSGFVVCSLDTHDGMCRNLCAGTGCVVVSVDYRLAPEAKFPRSDGRLPGGYPLGGGQCSRTGCRSGTGVRGRRQRGRQSRRGDCAPHP
jgi:acetyl esterase